MPSASPQTPVLLVCGQDEFGVKERARDVYGVEVTSEGAVDRAATSRLRGLRTAA